MAFKYASGKNTVVSTSAKSSIGTTKASTNAVGISPAKQSTQSNEGMDRVESVPPAEIVAISDFNRVYEPSTAASEREITKTPYGVYYDALKSLHSIASDDVTHVVSRALETNAGNLWTPLRDATEADTSNAEDLINDLSKLLNSIERVERSLDFGRDVDDEITTLAREYLQGRLKSYERKPEARDFNPKKILRDQVGQFNFRSDSNSEILKRMLQDIRDQLTLYTTTNELNNFLSDVSLKVPKNLGSQNSEGRYVIWEAINRITVGEGGTRFAKIAKIISHVLTISAAIPRIQDDPIYTKIAFKKSNIDGIFNGTSSRNLDPLPYKNKLSLVGPPSSIISLSLLQFDASSSGKTVLPLEVESSSKYRSGAEALVRTPLASGDYDLVDLNNYADKFSESFGDIEKYLDFMLGYNDPNNGLTPVEILRIIAKNFAIGLQNSQNDEDLLLQVHALRGLAVSGQYSDTPKHLLLGIALKLKEDQATGAGASGGGKSQQTQTVTRTSEDSTVLLPDAKATTTLSTSTTSEIESRIIALKSSWSSSALDDVVSSIVSAVSNTTAESYIDTDAGINNTDAIALLIYQYLLPVAQEIKSQNDVQQQIDEENENLRKLKAKRDSLGLVRILGFSIASLIAFVVGAGIVVGSAGTALLAALSSAGIAVDLLSDADKQAFAEYWKTREKIEKKEKVIAELEKEKARAVDTSSFVKYSEFILRLSGTIGRSSGTLFSQIVAAYDEIVSTAALKLTDDQRLTTPDGTTLRSNLDELGLMALIANTFLGMSSFIKLRVRKDTQTAENGSTSLGFDSLLLSQASLGYTIADINDAIEPVEDVELGTISCDEAESLRIAISNLMESQMRVQNSLAYISAFSQVLSNSTDELVNDVKDLLNDQTRRQVLDNETGRQLLSSITEQQIAYRRSLFDRHRPKADAGYLPARVAYSQQEDAALDYLLASPAFWSRSSENLRIVTAAVPSGFINSGKRYFNNSLSTTGLIEMSVGRKDHELDDLIFKEKTFLFDPQLFVTPTSFNNFTLSRKTSDAEAALSIAKRITFSLCTKDGAETFSYSSLKKNARYSSFSSKQFDEIVSNSVTSYLIETYLYKLGGVLFDESISLEVSDGVSQAGLSAIAALSQSALSDVVLPTADQINNLLTSDSEIDTTKNVDGLSTGDKELLKSLTSSYLLRNNRLLDRVLSQSKFDRVFSVIVDPDEFEIDREKSISQNNPAAEAMILSLTEQQLIENVFTDDEDRLKIVPRDPLAGGFSIGSLYCQFTPNLAGTQPGTLLTLARQSLSERLTSTPSTGLTSKKQNSKDGFGDSTVRRK